MSNEIKQKAGEIVGEASMCWDSTGSAVFDTEAAGKVVEKLISFIEQVEAMARADEAEACEKHCLIAYERGKKGEPYYFEDVVKEARTINPH